MHVVFDSSTKILELEVLKKCNLKCSYCCAESNLNHSQIDDSKRFSQIIKFLKLNIPNNYWIRLMGGEPVLFKYIQELIDYVNENYLGLTIFTNCLKPLPKLNPENIIITSLHYEYPQTWETTIKNTKDLENIVIYNVMVKDYYDYENFFELEDFINKVNPLNNKFIHAQIVTTDYYKPTYRNLMKWREYLKSMGTKDFYETQLNYETLINRFFSKKPFLCKCRTYQYTADGELHSDCEKFNLETKQILCENKICYYDNIMYI